MQTFMPGRCIAMMLVAILALTGCLESSDLSSAVATNDASVSFQGCLVATGLTTSAIQVQFEWPSGAQSVSILRNGISVYTNFGGVSSTYVDEGLLEGRTYSYTCTANFQNPYNNVIKTVNGTNIITGTTVSIHAPTFMGVSRVVQQSATSVQVEWPVADGVPTAKYVVVAKLGSDPGDNDFDSQNAASQTLINKNYLKIVTVPNAFETKSIIDGLGDQLDYHYAVRACSNMGNCSQGTSSPNVVAKTISDQGAPRSTGVSLAQLLDGQITLTVPWTPTDGQVSVRRVYRSATGGTNIAQYVNVQNFTVTDPTNVPNTLVLLGTIAEGTTYYYIVRDEDLSGNVNTNTQVASVSLGDLTPPPDFPGIRPATELLTPLQGQIMVKWGSPADWSDYRGFRIYTVNSDASLNFVKDCVCTGNDCVANPLNQCLVTNLDPYRTYKWHVRAFDAAGNLTTYLNPTISYAMKRTSDTTPPTFSSSLILGYSNGVTLVWNPATDNQYPLEPGINLRYQVWRKTGSPFIAPAVPSADADTGAPMIVTTDLNYTDSSVSGGFSYFYTICALDTTGNQLCDSNVGFRSVPDVTAPTVSTITSTKTTTSKVWNLSWTLSDNITPTSQIAVTIRRKVSTSATDFPVIGDDVLLSGQNITSLMNEGSPAIDGTAGVARYVNYQILVADLAGNVTTRTISILLDNVKPSSPTLGSFSPQPSFGSQNPTVVGVASSDVSSVDLYLTNLCTGAPAASGTRAQLTGAGLSVAVGLGNVNNIYVQSKSASATLGDCVLLGNYDNVAPTMGTVTVNGASNRGAADLNWSLSYGTYSSSDTQSYCIRQNSTNVAGCTWIAGSSLPSTFAVAAIEGTNYLSVWIRDSGLNVSAIGKSNDIVMDATRPAWSATVTAPAWTTSTNSLGTVTVSNLTATDANGIDKFEWAIGTTAPVSGDCAATCANIKAWTTLSTTTFTPTSLTPMNHNTTYYVNVRVLDLSGNYTAFSTSFKTDFVEPANPIFVTPSQGQSITVPAASLTTLTGTCEVGSTLVLTAGTGVVLGGTATCLGDGTFSASVYYLGLNFASSVGRDLSIKATKPSGLQSATITRSLNVTGSCPAGYLPVSGNATYGTTDFCVAKFEMKPVTANPVGQPAESRTLNNGGNVGGLSWGSGTTCDNTGEGTCFPEPRPDGIPWVNVSQQNALTACDRLNTGITGMGGTGPFQLITNAQWQTVATAIEQTANNWQGTNPTSTNSIGTNPVVGVNVINRGHTDTGTDANAVNNGLASSAGVLAAKTTPAMYVSGTNYGWSFANATEEFEAGYRGTGNSGTGGWQERRTHFLPSGGVIWDIGGNAGEWVRFTDNWCGNDSCLDSGMTGNTASTFNSRLLPQQGNEGSDSANELSFTLAGGTSVLEPWPGTANSLVASWFFPIGSYASAPSVYNFGRVNIKNNGAANTYAVQRGERLYGTTNAGIFAATLQGTSTGGNSAVSFRCAIKP